MNIRLREIEFDDLPSLNTWRNDPNLVSSLGTGYSFISHEVDLNWYRDYLSNREKAVRLAIEVDGEYVGNVNLTNINYVNRSAEFSILIGIPKFHGKGVGNFASSEIFNHGFKNLGLHRIWLTVLTTISNAIKLYQNLGFQNEGTLRQCILKNGKYHDMNIMSLLS